MKKENAVQKWTAHISQSHSNYTTLEAVKKYLSMNLPVIPLAPKEKTPNHEGTWQRKHTLDEFHEGDNIGLICGWETNGTYYMAFDFDKPDREIFDEFVKKLNEKGITGLIQKSGGKHGGYHLIVKTDKHFKNTKITFKKCEVEIEVKGNGYILIAPSRVKKNYQILQGSFKDLQTIKSETITKTIKDLFNVNMEFINKEIKKSTNNLTEDTSNTVVGSKYEKPLFDTDHRIILDSMDELFHTFKGWQILIDARNLRLPNELGKNFISLFILHGEKLEKHPSAEFYKGDNGSIVYRDFALNRTYTLTDVYYALKEKKTPPLIGDADRRKEFRSKWTAKFIDEFNIYTKDSLEYSKAFNKFIDEAIKREKVPERFVKVWRVIADKMVRAYDHGGDIFTARWLSQETGINDHVIANKALNLLVACGVLRKGEDKTLKEGKTPKIEPVKDFDVSEALRILSLLHEDLKKRKCRWNRFSRRAVIDVLGVEVANTIFTRGRDDVEDTNTPKQTDDEDKAERKEVQTDNTNKRKTKNSRKQRRESKEYSMNFSTLIITSTLKDP